MLSKMMELEKIKKIMIFVIVIIVILSISLIFSNGAKSETFLQLLQEERYQEAEKYYENVLCKSEREMQKAHEQVIQIMNNEIDEFNREEKSYQDAYHELEKYDSFYYIEVNEILSVLENLEESKSVYYEAENCFLNAKYYDAFRLYSNVIETDMRYAEAQSKLDDCSSNIFSSVLSECENEIMEGFHVSAIFSMRGRLSYFRNDDLISANEKIEEYIALYATHIENEVEDYWDVGNYEEGFSRIEIGISNIGPENALVSLKQKYIGKYEEDVVGRVNTYKKSKEYVDAAYLLDDAMQLVPDSKTIRDTYQDLKKYLPVELDSIEELNYKMNGKSRYDLPKDFRGNEYTYGIRYWAASVFDNYVEYDLDCNYKYFTSIITPSEKWSGKHKVPATFKINIWGDDKMLFEKEMTRESSPIEIELNVAGVKELKITFEKIDGYYDGYFLFANAYLYEEYDR